MRFEGVLFDVDGVVVDSPHERAWREALEALMATEWRAIAPETRYAPERFTTAVYQSEVAGKARESGARAALDYFGVPDAAERARLYAERKQEALLRKIEAGEFVVFPDAMRLILGLKARGVPIAAASSSRNAGQLLRRIRADAFSEQQRIRRPAVAPGTTLLDLFDADLCGVAVAHGKPAPDLFLAAARTLGVPPARCLVVEDAPAGVQAAKAAGMTALGVARLADDALLAAAGADRVVTTLDAVDPDAVVEGRIAARAA
ncbi:MULTISPECIES: HAD family phosphatase [Sorangium]|uniref:Haloacid dehalogenase n=1 Tax=Sorangium cellulosum TaxID=56 RepID=A0A4P2R602_SORCE|nr:MULTISPECIES: HAD-IA family hydrolase [Sorangium]AUX38218.1 haloacid dehalogenase [Sorangium cellulosum]WCQ97506.1 Beta-phosphoglucomutase [Sorangium sp. Soce836]